MPKWKASALIVLATVLCVAQTATEYETSDVMSIAPESCSVIAAAI